MACVSIDSLGAIAFVLASGQAHELPHAVPLLDWLPRVLGWLANRGYTSHLRDLGTQSAVSTQQHKALAACPG